MPQAIDGARLAGLVEKVAACLAGMHDELNRLDAAMGDGDMGISVSKGAQALRDYLAATPPGDDLGKWLAGAGMAFNRTAPSTIGALTATALMRAGKEARDRAELDAPTLARMLLAADAAIQERGKARPGDKTIIDALHPAAEAFALAIEQGSSLREAGLAALQAARTGRDAAIPLRSQVGRAHWVGERTEGQPDPGTVLLVRLFEAVLGEPASDPGSTL